METGTMEKGVMETEAMGAMTGASVAAVVATEVEDIRLVATETAGKNRHRVRSSKLVLLTRDIKPLFLLPRGQGGYERSGTYRDSYEGYGKH